MRSIIIWISVAEVIKYGKKPAPLVQSPVVEQFRYIKKLCCKQIIIDQRIYNKPKRTTGMKMATISNLKTYVLYENALQSL